MDQVNIFTTKITELSTAKEALTKDITFTLDYSQDKKRVVKTVSLTFEDLPVEFLQEKLSSLLQEYLLWKEQQALESTVTK
jgi:hypothetical protein